MSNYQSTKTLIFALASVWILTVITFIILDLRKDKSLLKTQVSSMNINPDENSKHKSEDNLKKTVEGALVGTQGTYGVVVKNLSTGEIYSFNENRIFDPGSLYKLWVMVVTYEQIERGLFSEDDVLSQDINELNNQFGIPPDAAEITDGSITLSVKDALNQMITISHNYAALLLIEKIKRSSIQNFLADNHFVLSTTGDEPKTTPKEITTFLEKLYKGEYTNPENTIKMISLLKAQTKNEKLPKYLPSGTEVAHKTGEIDNYSHDAGIVYTPKGDYIIVVLSESDSPFGAEERIANISKAVYEYFATD